jgi:hypothetical protein
MHATFLAAALLAGFLVGAPAAAEAACCDQPQQKPCCTHQHATEAKPCCTHQHPAEPETIAFDWQNDPQLAPAPPVRQLAEVWFHRPVLVGKAILQGRYVIEHDNERMARGEPCTHIYAFDDRSKPVAAFHCTHLERDRADQNLVVLVTEANGMQRLVEFQFAGETASHGYPAAR